MTSILSQHYLATRTRAPTTTTTPAHTDAQLAFQRKAHKMGMVWDWLLDLPMHFRFDGRLSGRASESDDDEYAISEDDEGIEDDGDKNDDDYVDDVVGKKVAVVKQHQQRPSRKPAAENVYMSELPPRYRKRMRMRIKDDDEDKLALADTDGDEDVKARLTAAMKTMQRRENAVKMRPKLIPRSRKVGVLG